MNQPLTNLELEEKAKWLRSELFEMFLQAKQGHPGSVLSLTTSMISALCCPALWSVTPERISLALAQVKRVAIRISMR